MAQPRRTTDGLSSRDRAGVKIAAIMGWTRIGLAAIRWGGIGLTAYFVYRAAETLAGKTTLAAFLLDFVEQKEPDRWVAWITAAITTWYGLRQKRLRQKAIARHGDRIKELESRIDKKRSSSYLDEKGRTPPNL